jgi:hypothetical protein
MADVRAYSVKMWVGEKWGEPDFVYLALVPVAEADPAAAARAGAIRSAQEARAAAFEPDVDEADLVIEVTEEASADGLAFLARKLERDERFRRGDN